MIEAETALVQFRNILKPLSLDDKTKLKFSARFDTLVARLLVKKDAGKFASIAAIGDSLCTELGGMLKIAGHDPVVSPWAGNPPAASNAASSGDAASSAATSSGGDKVLNVIQYDSEGKAVGAECLTLQTAGSIIDNQILSLSCLGKCALSRCCLSRSYLIMTFLFRWPAPNDMVGKKIQE